MRFLWLALLSALPVGAAPPSDLAVRLAEVQRARADLAARRSALTQQHEAEVRTIESLKAQPPSLARDYRLEPLLAAAQARATELERLQVELSARDRGIAELQRQLGQPPAAIQPRSLTIATAAIDPLDGPHELGDKADLVQDSQDRVARELERVAQRIASLERHRRLRERSGALDEDLFIESGSGRRIVRVGPVTSPREGGFEGFGDTKASASGAPAPQVAVDSSAPPGGGANARFGTALRGVLDPATLDELRQSEAGSDDERQLHALHLAETRLRTLAQDLGARAAVLRQRAKELTPRKK